MYDVDDLKLIRAELQKLLYTTYFREPLTEYYVVTHSDGLGQGVVDLFRHQTWRVLRYLSGSTSKEIPYEVVYALDFALCEWIRRPAIITTALFEELDFRFERSLSWKDVQTLLPGFEVPANDHLLVQIALPRLYRQRPLYAVPLYHELGHFVDTSHQISERIILSSIPRFDRNNAQHITALAHMREYFADLFAASYCGLSAGRPLELIASANPVSHTHPSTADRLQTIHDFVAGNAVPVASAFNLVLGRVGLPTLHVRFVEPQLESAFDAIRPASIASVDELHGIFSAGWRYLDDVRAGNRATWAGFGPEESTRIINDLIEKSIRNRQILEHWRDAASQ